MAHDRDQFLTKFNRHLVEPFLGLIQLSLYSIILYVELLIDRNSLIECHVSSLLLSFHLIDMFGQGGQCLDGTCSILAHVGEHRREHIHVTGFIQCLQEHDQRSVGIILQQVGKLLHVKPGHLRIFGRLTIQADDDL